MNNDVQRQEDGVSTTFVTRKVFHLIAASTIPVAYYLEVIPRPWIFWLAVLAMLLWVAIDFARISNEKIGKFVADFLGGILKSKESNSLTGSSYVLISTVLSLTIFAPAVAVTALLFNAVGDPVAAIIGGYWGKTSAYMSKTVEGSLGMFFVCAAIGIMILGVTIVAIIGAVVATLAELYITGVDDNLSTPLIAGAAMTLVEAVV